MKLWTNSSIQTCHGRLFRGAGAFRFDSAGLGEGTGVGEVSATLGEGDGVRKAVGEGCGDGCAIGVGVAGTMTSGFLGDRNRQSPISPATARIIGPSTTGLHFGRDFFSPVGVRSFN